MDTLVLQVPIRRMGSCDHQRREIGVFCFVQGLRRGQSLPAARTERKEASLMSQKTQNKTRMLVEGALMVALALVLNELKLFRLPNGGSISLEMLPIFLMALRWGCAPGLLVGFVYGLLQIFIDGAIAWGWQSLLLDYLVAFTPLGLAGLFRKMKGGVYVGPIVGAFVRFVVHFISGITIYKIVAPTELFNVTFTSPWMYSLAYNGSYMLISLIICLILLALMMATPLKRFILDSEVTK
jgi:thiamine transporter